MDLRDEIREVSKELNYPSAPKLLAALLRRGLRVSLAEVRDFTRGQVSRQVFRKVPTVFGRVVASGINARWAADLIDFTASPDEGYQYVLVVQDIFSRKLMTAPLRKNDPDEVLRAFRRFVAEEGEPKRVDTDGGPEFTKNFTEYLDEVLEVPHVVKDSSDVNALATLDRAIRTLKEDLARVLTEEGNDGWVEALPRVTKGYNQQAHSGLHNAAPDEVKDNLDVQFSLKKDMLRAAQENDALIRKRAQELLATGVYRVAAKKDKLKRGFKPNYSKEVHEVANVNFNTVTDAKGDTVLVKRVLPVPRGSAEARIPRMSLPGSVQTESRQKAQLEPFRAQILDYVEHTSEALLENVAIRMKALGVPKVPGKTTRQILELMGFRVVPRFPDNPARGFVVRPPS